MKFIQFKNGPMDNFQYIIADETNGKQESAIIDPAFDAEKIMSFDFKFTHILLTHTHFDHVNRVKEIQELTGAKVYVQKNCFHELPVEFTAIQEGDLINIGNTEIKVIETPGHLTDQVCYIFEDKIITGDTLFIDGCGRTDLPGGDTTEQYNSLQKIKSLDEDLTIYPGHDYGDKSSDTIKNQKITNRFLTCQTLEEFKFLRS